MRLFSARPIPEESREAQRAFLRNLGMRWNEAVLPKSGEDDTKVDTLEKLRALALEPIIPSLRGIEVDVEPQNATESRSEISQWIRVLLKRYRDSKLEKLEVKMPVNFEDVFIELKAVAWQLRELKLIIEIPNKQWKEKEKDKVERLRSPADAVTRFLQVVAETCRNIKSIHVAFCLAEPPAFDFGKTLGPLMWKGHRCQELVSLNIEGVLFKPLTKGDIHAMGDHWGSRLRTLRLEPDSPTWSDVLGTPIGLLLSFGPKNFPALRFLGLRVEPNPDNGLPDARPLTQLEFLDVGTSTPPTDRNAVVQFFTTLLPNGRLIDGPPPYEALETKVITWADVVDALDHR